MTQDTPQDTAQEAQQGEKQANDEKPVCTLDALLFAHQKLYENIAAKSVLTNELLIQALSILSNRISQEILRHTIAGMIQAQTQQVAQSVNANLKDAGT